MQKIADVKYAAAVLQWDQETYLPPQGNAFRGRQLATLSTLAHEQFTDPATGNVLEELLSFDGLNDTQRRNVELNWEDFNRSKKLPAQHVHALSEAVSAAYHDWVEARKANDFSRFENSLQQLVALKQQETELLGYDGHPYDALMDEFDKGLTVATTDDLFGSLQPALQRILNEVQSQPQVNNDFLFQRFDKDVQWQMGIQVLKAIGFNFEAGRQDLSVHPFTTSFNPQDVRVTTRVDENDFGNMLWSCIHEGGHALYEQGLPAEQYGLPLGEYCSLSIHESQSRFWENNIGRGKAFWNAHFAEVQRLFPEQLGSCSVEDFYKGINRVQPSLIRTEADELTYHFHVMIRYEIEKGLIEGSLKVKDIPGYWNEMYHKYLGVTVPDDVQGCLQDIHWSHGSFGYFATYSIGSLYAAQLHAAMEQELPNVSVSIANGDTSAVLDWLRKSVHQYGRRYSSAQLCTKITGEALNSRYFLDYAAKKFHDIYHP